MAMSTWIAAAIAVAAIAATYVFCVRPAMRGRCAMSAMSAMSPSSSQDSEADRELAQLREELRMLRAQDALDSGRVSHPGPIPPGDS